MKKLFKESNSNEAVKISDITLNKDNPRVRYDKAQIKRLAENIKELGLLNPIIIDEYGVILSGNRRFLAVKEFLNWEYILCDVYVNLPKHIKTSILISANTTQKKLDIWRNRETIARLYWDEFLENFKPTSISDKGFSEFARLLGISHTHVQRLVMPFSVENKGWLEQLRIANMPPDIADRIVTMRKADRKPIVNDLIEYKKNNKNINRNDLRNFLSVKKREYSMLRHEKVSKHTFTYFYKKAEHLNNILTTQIIELMDKKQKDKLLALIDKLKKKILA